MILNKACIRLLIVISFTFILGIKTSNTDNF